jgi:RNA polymerase-associated protein
MLTLYDAPRCPYCARARIVLAEKGVPYETVTVDLQNRPARLLEHNPPHGRVPVLEEDEWVLAESTVINEYLEERYPDPPLLPVDPAERAAARLVVFRFDDLGKPYYAFRRDEPGADALLADDLMGLSLDPHASLSRWVDACAARPSVAAEIETVASLAA